MSQGCLVLCDDSKEELCWGPVLLVLQDVCSSQNGISQWSADGAVAKEMCIAMQLHE